MRHRQVQRSAAQFRESGTRSRLSLGTLLAVAIGLAALVFSATAGAAEKVEYGSFGSSGSAAGQLRRPGGVAVDGSTGNVYVADTVNNRIDEFEAEGGFIRAFGWGVEDGSAELQVCEATCQAGLSGGGAGELNEVVGVAVAPGGFVYTANRGDGRIQKFTLAGAFVEEFGGYGTEPAETDKFGQPLSLTNAIAVGAGGNVFVADSGKSRVAVFSAAGAYLTEASGPVISMTTDPSGGFWVAGSAYPVVVRHYDEAGAPVGEFSIPDPNFEGIEPRGLAIDPNSGDILIEGARGFGPELTYSLREFTPTGELIRSTPLSFLKKPSNFEVPSYGIAATAATAFPAFKPGAVYLTDLVAGQVFMTGEIARPHVTSVTTSGLGTEFADLSGKVNPEALPTEYFFEYGTTAAYGSRFPVDGAQLEATTEDETVGAHLTHLAPGTTYHFQLVAVNGEGRSVSGDHTFTTYPAGGPTGLPDGRAYELVTPVDKGGNDAEPHGLFNSAGMAGEDEAGVLYSTLNGLPGSEAGALIVGNVAKRGASGWSTTVASGPELNQTTLATGTPVMVSNNLQKALIASKVALTPGAPANGGQPNLYIHNLEGGGYQLVTDRPIPQNAIEQVFEVNYSSINAVGASKDFNHVFFETNVPLTADSQQDANSEKLYEFSGGVLRNVGILPGETTPVAGAVGAYPSSLRPVSEDGSQVLFNVEAAGAPQLFLRKNDAQTIEVSAPEENVNPGSPQRATFVGASADGSVVFFTSAEKLTADAYTGESESGTTNLEANLYRYDVATGKLTDLTTTATGEELGPDVRTAIVSPDGKGVFFVAGGILAPGAKTPGANNLYHWGQGEGVTFVAQMAARDNLAIGAGTPEAGTDTSGNAIAFVSTGGQGGPSTDGVPEIYRWSTTEGLACASCGSGPIQSGARMPGAGMALGSGAGHPISADGSKVFFTTADALVLRDTNGKEDAYEWEGGTDRLLSSGTGNSGSFFIDASPSGKDVFFATRDRLVKADQDENADIYDAREGGGFAEAAPEAAPCEAEACRPPLAAAPAPAQLSSKGFHHEKKHHKHKKKQKGKHHKKKQKAKGKHRGKKSHKAHSGGKRG